MSPIFGTNLLLYLLFIPWFYEDRFILRRFVHLRQFSNGHRFYILLLLSSYSNTHHHHRTVAVPLLLRKDLFPHEEGDTNIVFIIYLIFTTDFQKLLGTEHLRKSVSSLTLNVGIVSAVHFIANDIDHTDD